MILSNGVPKHCEYKIYDANNNRIAYVKSFDTETGEIEVYLPICGESVSTDPEYLYEFDEVESDLRLATVKFVLNGAYAVDPNGIIV